MGNKATVCDLKGREISSIAMAEFLATFQVAASSHTYVQTDNYGAMLMPVTGFKTSIPSGGNVSETCWVWP